MTIKESHVTEYWLQCDACKYAIRQPEGTNLRDPSQLHAPYEVTIRDPSARFVTLHYCNTECFEYGTDVRRANRLDIKRSDKAFPKFGSRPKEFDFPPK